jgi:hypothetical protein
MYNKEGFELDPFLQKRDAAYQEMFDKIGNSKDNIKVVSNYMPKFACDMIIQRLADPKGGWGNQWDGRAFQSEELFEVMDPFIKSTHSTIERLYDTKVDQVGSGVVIKWNPGDSMGPHIDDWGVQNYHITGVIYLSDGYEGGEISFPTQGVTVKPKQGDLVMFPGNLYYEHEVKEVTSGERYTIPLWFRFVTK